MTFAERKKVADKTEELEHDVKLRSRGTNAGMNERKNKN